MDEKYVFFKIEISNSNLPGGLFIPFRLPPSILFQKGSELALAYISLI